MGRQCDCASSFIAAGGCRSILPSGQFPAGRAPRAYEIIVIAFAKGDLATLGSLLTRICIRLFSEQVIHRQTEGQQQELLLQTMNQAIISDAELNAEPRPMVDLPRTEYYIA